MPRVAYVNGQYVPHRSAAVHIVRIDGEPVGRGIPRPLSGRLRERYLAHAAAAA